MRSLKIVRRASDPVAEVPGAARRLNEEEQAPARQARKVIVETARPFPAHFEAKRLILRRWREDDRAAVVEIWADPDPWRSIGPGVMGTRFDADYAAVRLEHHLEHWEQYGFGLWLADERVSCQVAGWVGAAHPTYVPELRVSASRARMRFR